MKILQVNKYFYLRAGAETSYFDTRRALEDAGQTVIDFAMRSDEDLSSAYARYFAPERTYDKASDSRELTKLVGDSLATIYSRAARASLSNLLDDVQPDVAHLHNIYHQLSYSIVDELAARHIPIVQTVHDWKIACPSYNLFRDGDICHECVGHWPVGVVKHRCMKGSAAASAVALVEATVARIRRSPMQVNRYIAPSQFAKRILLDVGIPATRIDVIPHALPPAYLAEEDNTVPDRATFLFAGRLDATKGVTELLEAIKLTQAERRFLIAGWGPLAEEVTLAASADPRIKFLGQVPRTEIAELLRNSSALLLPSVWEDNSPMVILEAHAVGVPVIVSDRGGPPEFVDPGVDGLVVDPTDSFGFAAAIDLLAENPSMAVQMGHAGREKVKRTHDPARHIERLLSCYSQAISTL